MTIATSEEQHAVCEAIAAWAAQIRTTELVRADLDKPRDQWVEHFAQLGEFGVMSVVLAESDGGLDGTLLDAAAMVEQCEYDLVPGLITETAVAALALAGEIDNDNVALRAGLASGEVSAVIPAVVRAGGKGEYDLGTVRGYRDGAAILLRLPDEDADDGQQWRLLPPGHGAVDAVARDPVDGLGAVARLRISGLGADAVIVPPDPALLTGAYAALTAAYASGVSRWALDTAVDYAKVRTQFGAVIGTFQAVKHLCAETRGTKCGGDPRGRSRLIVFPACCGR